MVRIYQYFIYYSRESVHIRILNHVDCIIFTFSDLPLHKLEVNLSISDVLMPLILLQLYCQHHSEVL